MKTLSLEKMETLSGGLNEEACLTDFESYCFDAYMGDETLMFIDMWNMAADGCS
jgi:hypothetical protein